MKIRHIISLFFILISASVSSQILTTNGKVMLMDGRIVKLGTGTPYNNPVTNLSLTWVDNYANLTWDDTNDGENGYYVDEYVNGVWSAKDTLAANSTSATFTTYQNADLSYRVRSFQGANLGTNVYSDTIRSPLVLVTTKYPSGLNIDRIGVGGDTVFVNWGDGNIDTLAASTNNVSNTYASAGTHYVQFQRPQNMSDLRLSGSFDTGNSSDISNWQWTNNFTGGIRIEGMASISGDISHWDMTHGNYTYVTGTSVSGVNRFVNPNSIVVRGYNSDFTGVEFSVDEVPNTLGELSFYNNNIGASYIYNIFDTLLAYYETHTAIKNLTVRFEGTGNDSISDTTSIQLLRAEIEGDGYLLDARYNYKDIIANSFNYTDTSYYLVLNTDESRTGARYRVDTSVDASINPSNIFGYALSTSPDSMTYGVYADVNRKPYVFSFNHNTKEIIKSELDTIESDPYRAANDGHNRFNIAKDKDGYIHVIGDMHGHKINVDQTHLPDRYKGTTGQTYLLYWKSRLPNDISLFNFKGADSIKCPPGYNYSYMQMLVDNNGELYVKYRAEAGNSDSWAAHTYEDAFIVSKYNTADSSWASLGQSPDPTGGVNAFFYLTPDSSNNYQGNQREMIFDDDNRMHLFTNEIVSVGGSAGYSAFLYAWTDDDGQTFYRADSTIIDSIPMNYWEVSPPDTFWYTNTDATPLGLPVGMINKYGVPSMLSTDFYASRMWSFKDGDWNLDQDTTHTQYYYGSYVDNYNVFQFRNMYGYDFRYLNYDSRYEDITGSDVAYRHAIPNYVANTLAEATSPTSLKYQGVHLSLAASNTDSVIYIYEYSTAPIVYDALPEGLDLTSANNTVDSTFLVNDIFNITSDGYGITSGGDYSGAFVYDTVTGDFSIECRVNELKYITDSTFAGLLVTDATTMNNNQFANVLTYTGVETWESDGTKGYDQGYNVPAEWLKLRRIGNVVTAYRGDNGHDWVKVDEYTMTSNEVYVGMFVGSGNTTTTHAIIQNLRIKEL